MKYRISFLESNRELLRQRMINKFYQEKDILGNFNFIKI